MQALPFPHDYLKAGGYNMPMANMQLGTLYANFSDLEHVVEHMTKALTRLTLQHKELTLSAKSGMISLEDYDQQLSEFIRRDIGKQLAIIRHKVMKRARSGMKSSDRGAASSAVFRRSYKDVYGGNINIASPGKRMSSRKRPYVQGHQRDVAARTKQLNEYYGPDRSFVLRILEIGRDAFMAESTTGAKGKGSRATWGRRGALAARGFFHTMQPDMEAAAERLGQDITNFVENLIER